MRNIHLAFHAEFWPTHFLILAVEINTGVASRSGHHFAFELKIFKWLLVTGVKQVASFTETNQLPILNLPGIFIFTGFPAIKSGPIPKVFPF